MAALEAHGTVARILLAGVKGSAPRDTGTEMLVWSDGFSGTIGGGALEWQALARAREVLDAGAPQVLRVPLGPGLGQCCGGAVTLVIERIDAMPPDPWVRKVEGTSAAPSEPFDGLQSGWLFDTSPALGKPIWIWGAGHVGRAIVDVFAPLPDLALTWIDVAPDRFPAIPNGVTKLIASDPPLLITRAPLDAHHLILTHSHDIDLALCHAALLRGFASCGLIGSATKWARFQSRLRDLGHCEQEVGRITCPIGDPRFGKHPQAIAVGVAAALL